VRQSLQRANLKYVRNIGPLKQGFRDTVLRITKIFKVSTLSFHADIARRRLVEPYFFPPPLTGAVYRDFLRTVLPELLQDVDVQTGNHLLTWICLTREWYSL
jgi:hypothetical protein